MLYCAGVQTHPNPKFSWMVEFKEPSMQVLGRVGLMKPMFFKC